MTELSQTMGQVMHRPSWLPVPGFALEAMLGDGAIVVLEGQRVLPQRTLASGFEYQYADLNAALTQILTE
jgi:NAD dependent epimerase/dehydratase family enzyme